jgi:hypothetical protein
MDKSRALRLIQDQANLWRGERDEEKNKFGNPAKLIFAGYLVSAIGSGMVYPYLAVYVQQVRALGEISAASALAILALGTVAGSLVSFVGVIQSQPDMLRADKVGNVDRMVDELIQGRNRLGRHERGERAQSYNAFRLGNGSDGLVRKVARMVADRPGVRVRCDDRPDTATDRI